MVQLRNGVLLSWGSSRKPIWWKENAASQKSPFDSHRFSVLLIYWHMLTQKSQFNYTILVIFKWILNYPQCTIKSNRAHIHYYITITWLNWPKIDNSAMSNIPSVYLSASSIISYEKVRVSWVQLVLSWIKKPVKPYNIFNVIEQEKYKKYNKG